MSTRLYALYGFTRVNLSRENDPNLVSNCTLVRLQRKESGFPVCDRGWKHARRAEVTPTRGKRKRGREPTWNSNGDASIVSPVASWHVRPVFKYFLQICFHCNIAKKVM